MSLHLPPCNVNRSARWLTRGLRTLRLSAALLASALVLGGCGGGGGDDFDSNEAAPLLTVTIVNMAPAYNAAQMRKGDVRFENFVVKPFGAELPSTLSPAIEYITVVNATVRACAPGVVTRVAANDGIADSEIHIAPFEGSRWLLIYDHVTGVTVSEGDDVVAGTSLGVAGVWSGTARRVELQINDRANDVAVCPLSIGSVPFRNTHEVLRQTIVNEGFGPLPTLCEEETVEP